MTTWEELRAYIQSEAVVHSPVTLSSGAKSDYYIDLRRVTLAWMSAALVGQVMLDLVEGWSFDAVGGLTLGADPIAYAMMHASLRDSGWPLDAFVVRKAGKTHGLQRRVEGPDVAGKRVVVVEDTSTTGASLLTAVDVLRDEGADVVGVAVLVDRGARAAVEARGLEYRAAYSLEDLGLGR